ncbi:phosphate transporter permease [Salmonella enterica subsp. enterica serovar Bovismorbificans]|nr:phosphate transporter permease [Salmonella enterica subsp. enterica serovar Bovismorbificans]
MATLDMQNTAQLAESRRKMQARRRMKNRIALTLSMATMAFGLFWLIWILMSTITRGIDGMSLALFTEMTPPPGAGERPGGEWIIDSLGYRIGYAAGDYGGYLPGRVWP